MHPADVVVIIVVDNVKSIEIVVVTGCALLVIVAVVMTVTVTVMGFLDLAATDVVAVIDAVEIRVVVEVFA